MARWGCGRRDYFSVDLGCRHDNLERVPGGGRAGSADPHFRGASPGRGTPASISAPSPRSEARYCSSALSWRAGIQRAAGLPAAHRDRVRCCGRAARRRQRRSPRCPGYRPASMERASGGPAAAQYRSWARKRVTPAVRRLVLRARRLHRVRAISRPRRGSAGSHRIGPAGTHPEAASYRQSVWLRHCRAARNRSSLAKGARFLGKLSHLVAGMDLQLNCVARARAGAAALRDLGFARCLYRAARAETDGAAAGSRHGTAVACAI